MSVKLSRRPPVPAARSVLPPPCPEHVSPGMFSLPAGAALQRHMPILATFSGHSDLAVPGWVPGNHCEMVFRASSSPRDVKGQEPAGAQEKLSCRALQSQAALQVAVSSAQGLGCTVVDESLDGVASRRRCDLECSGVTRR